MKKWIFQTITNEIIWETSVEEYAKEFIKLLDNKGVKYVITIQE